MWPWGHLALGYLLYSPAVRLLRRRGPAAAGALALALGTQFPDLLDKPLAWVLGVTSQGYTVGHSVFVAVPLAVLVVSLAARHDRTEAGLAFAVGHLSHLLGDVLFAVALRNPYTIERVLWPVANLPAGGQRAVTGRVLEYAAEWVAYLLATDQGWFVALYVGTLLGAFCLWLLDGVPGLPRPSWFRDDGAARQHGEERTDDKSQ
ncbi:metal-dependent hydrolase [Haloglomus halophilum]|uniref:metal-dependent hydrolase n=1 Tax=Haloglomus halophilum TaxID=2962672 RepID=UPI0020C94FBD|nr:metal-dependent hydrolase [Haloglomus halophilum]